MTFVWLQNFKQKKKGRCHVLCSIRTLIMFTVIDLWPLQIKQFIVAIFCVCIHYNMYMIEETIALNVPTERPKIIGCDSRFQLDIEQGNTIIVFVETSERDNVRRGRKVWRSGTRRKIDNTMANRKWTKGLTTIYKTYR